MPKIKVIKHQKKFYIYYHNGKTLRVATGISVDDKSVVSKKKVNHQLERVTRIVNEYFFKNDIYPSKDYVKNKLDEVELPKGKFFIDYYDAFIQSKIDDKIKPQSMKDYYSLKNCWIEYEQIRGKRFSFDEIDKNRINDFIDFLISDERLEGSKLIGNLNNNTIKKRLTSFKTYLRFLINREVYNFPAAVLSYNARVQSYNIDIVSLNKEEIKQLMDLKLTGLQEVVRDIFIFGCMTSFRYSDILKLNGSHVNGRKIVKRPEKAQYKELYRVRMNDVAFEIWNKYEHNLNRVPSQLFNREIKKICKENNLFTEDVDIYRYVLNKSQKNTYKKYELISSHTARRSFITNALNVGISIPDLMKMTSHTKIATLMKYINLNEEVNDDIVDKLNPLY